MTSPCKFPEGVEPDAWGYGHKWSPELGRTTTASKAAWIKKFGVGSIPPGCQINHVCDEPFCVQDDDEGVYVLNGKEFKRLGHLWLGTQQDNMDDMIAKGRDRHPRGEENHKSIFVPQDISDILRLRSCGLSHQKIANLYGCSKSAIVHIMQGRVWSHVK